MTRALPLFAALVLASCSPSADEGADLPLDDESPDQAGAAECVVDAECTPAGESCCACPTYAVSTASGWDESCEDVACEEPTSCSTEAACDLGQCVLRCAAVACDADASCEAGFARDGDGCLSCVCAEPADPSAGQCQLDSDCVRVPADCCGCAEGGSDIAVPANEATDFSDSLGCDGSASCPGVDVCDIDAEPRCVAGICRLQATGRDDGTDGGLDGTEQLCGTPQLAPCAPGQQCVLNDPDSPQASEMGVGVCR